jgi:LL-diaminopimelate aminotransferase
LFSNLTSKTQKENKRKNTMIQTNKNYNTLNKYAKNNVFREVSLRTEKYVASNPRLPVIKIGIGDVTRPLPQCVLDAMHNAVNDMGNMATFKGYPPDYGYS